MKKESWANILQLDFWIAVIIFGVLLNLIIYFLGYAPVLYKKIVGVSDIEQCSDQRYLHKASLEDRSYNFEKNKKILKEQTLEEKFSKHFLYSSYFKECEIEKKQAPDTFKLKFNK